jgi:DNA invertase Pin-like site-specific DNA recombinase
MLQTVTILEYLLNNDINFISLSDNFDTTTPYGKALLYMAAVFAQLEVDLIKERTIEGLEAARLEGRVGGRRKISQVTQSTLYQMYYSGDYSVTQICEECHISTTTLYKYLHMYNSNPETTPEIIDFERPPIKPKKISKRKAGRPTTNKATIKKIQEMSSNPKYSVNDILNYTGVSRSTFYKYYKQRK